VFNEELASRILLVLNKSFPTTLDTSTVWQLLPKDAPVSEQELLKATDALIRDGFADAKVLRGAFGQLESAANLVITPSGHSQLRDQNGRAPGANDQQNTGKKGALSFESAFEKYGVANPVPVGSGGSGVVYEVRDGDGNRYALKVINIGADTKKLKRFKNEIFFCFANIHPNIVRVLDYGVSIVEGKSRPFYVMPFYPATLRAKLSRSISAADVLRIFTLILDGVEAAHLLNVVHRDLKPENVLCDENAATLVIADFGIARFKEEDLHTAVETHNHERLANFLYSAPEQRERGREIDERTDIFALGLMLNELFTGKVPQGSGFKRITEVSPDHAYLDALVDEMMQQDPTKRPKSVKEVKLNLVARGNEFVGLQKLDRLKASVISDRVIGDAIVERPITLVGVDWDSGILKLKLSQSPNAIWIQKFVGLRSYSALAGKGPPRFTFNRDEAEIHSSEGDAQITVDRFKQYLALTNTQYTSAIETDKRREIEQRDRKLREQIASTGNNIKTRERILKNIRI
jgi:serine/threonine protein kinase